MTLSSHSLSAPPLLLSLIIHGGVILFMSSATNRWIAPQVNKMAGNNAIDISIFALSGQSNQPDSKPPSPPKRVAIPKISTQPKSSSKVVNLVMSQEVDGSADDSTSASTSNKGATSNAVSASASGSGAGAAVPSYQVSNLPKVLQEVKAEFPPEAKKLGLSGKVVLSVIIEADGTVRSAQVVKPAGYGFDQRAEKALLRFRFAPATLNGNAVVTEIKYTYVFELK